MSYQVATDGDMADHRVTHRDGTDLVGKANGFIVNEDGYLKFWRWSDQVERKTTVVLMVYAPGYWTRVEIVR